MDVSIPHRLHVGLEEKNVLALLHGCPKLWVEVYALQVILKLIAGKLFARDQSQVRYLLRYSSLVQCPFDPLGASSIAVGSCCRLLWHH